MSTEATNGFLFLLDPGTGKTISGLMKVSFTDGGYRVTSPGFHVENSSKVFMAFNHLSASELSPEQPMLLGVWDSNLGTMTYLRGSTDASSSTYHGVSASLAIG